MPYDMDIHLKRWPLRKPFKISRDVHTHADTLECEIRDGEHVGRGEAAGVSYAGETTATMCEQLEAVADQITGGLSLEAAQHLLPPGGARNALDCALWDLEAKRRGKTIWELIGWQPQPVTTVYTVGIAEPDEMQKDAAEHSDYPVLKVKVGIGDPIQQISAIRAGSPNADIVIDANQAWTVADLEQYTDALMNLGVRMIEQPMAIGADEALRGHESPLPLCADESCATTKDLERLQGLYSMVNIKLDKAGGLTESLELAQKAEAMGFELMVGNMLGSSLAMAPAFVIAQRCRYVDIDGPLLQAEDCDHAMVYKHGNVDVFSPLLWG